MIKLKKPVLSPIHVDELKKFPTQGILCEILETGLTGEIIKLSDDVVVIKENCSDPFAFISGELTSESVLSITELLKDCQFPMVYCAKKYHSLFLEQGWNFHLRAILSLTQKVAQNPASITKSKIIKIDSLDMFRKCTWHKERTELYGGEQGFIEHGTGYALFTEDGALASEAYASVGCGYAEIGVITAPEHRGKGYATQVASYLISNLLSRKIIPEWSCNIDNIASLKTGIKLGFQIADYYTLLVPNCGNVLCANLVRWLEKNPYP